MEENNETIYEKLREHLDSMPVGYPKTESGIEIKILKHLFTPEEAELATKLNFFPLPLEKIYRRVKKSGISIEELEKKLNEMHEKGLIDFSKQVENGKEIKYYANPPFVVGIFEYQLKRLSKEFIKDVKQYFEETFMEREFNAVGVPQLRIVPIEQSISPDLSVSTYDNIRDIVKYSRGPFAIAECICRKTKDILGEPCKKTDLRELCITLGHGAITYLEKGLGREVSREEILDILDKAEDIGLVLQPGNAQRPLSICCCCGCCCEVLLNEKKLSEPARFFATNFHAFIDDDLCSGCGTCEERCNMDAVKVDDGIAKVLIERCIGCGVCVPTCPVEAIKLEKNEKELVPPKSYSDTYLTIMKKKAELARKKKEI